MCMRHFRKETMASTAIAAALHRTARCRTFRWRHLTALVQLQLQVAQWTRQFASTREDDDSDSPASIENGQSTSSSGNTRRTSSTSAVREASDENKHRRIWLSDSSTDPLYWSDDVAHSSEGGEPKELASLLDRIEKQELEGGRMRTSQLGVVHEDPGVDMRLLTENYTVGSLASALRDREDVLQYCAQLAAVDNIIALKNSLKNFHPDIVLERRRETQRLDVRKPLNTTSLETIRKALMRMPRRVTTAHSRRAGIVILICHVDGVPSLLLEKRARSLRAHPDEVCFPGGMVCNIEDRSIVETCLREMKEEIGGLSYDYERMSGGSGISVLGVLRCNWGDVHHLVGVAVTPVVCVLGQDLGSVDLKPNPEEVAEVFTIPLASLLDKSQWIYKEDHAPIFVGGPYVIWGLTGYILNQFWRDILLPFNVKSCRDGI
jgi:8-oxo-dGTP pyrophosphatase MutT (NUDIX family)